MRGCGRKISSSASATSRSAASTTSSGCSPPTRSTARWSWRSSAAGGTAGSRSHRVSSRPVSGSRSADLLAAELRPEGRDLGDGGHHVRGLGDRHLLLQVGLVGRVVGEADGDGGKMLLAQFGEVGPSVFEGGGHGGGSEGGLGRTMRTLPSAGYPDHEAGLRIP